MKKLFTWIVCTLLAVPAFSQRIVGTWNGLLDAGETKLHIVFNIEEKNGVYTATMDSPDQGAKGLPVSEVSFTNDTLILKMADLGVNYTGTLKNDSIIGIFTQGPYTLSLCLTRSTTVEVKRSQDPQKPYTYNSEELKFENKKAGITLAGTLTWPKEGSNFPVAILVTGSGRQNRNEEILNHRPFLVLADYLTRNGIAVLRYDDRETGESGGVYATSTIQDFATDAMAAVNYLKTRKEINLKKIGIIGHSEGSAIAFMMANQNKELAFIVSMAGCAVKGDSLMRAQRYALMHQMGVSDAAIQQNENLVRDIERIIKKYSADSVYKNPTQYVDEILPAEMKGNPAVQQTISAELRKMAAPEIQSFMAYDPATDLKKIKCPVLALNGDKDLQVPADMNLNQIKALVKSSVTVKKYVNLNHLFQHCTTGLPNEYATIDETLSPEVLSDIATWIKQVVK